MRRSTVEYTVIGEAKAFLAENSGKDLFEIREYDLSNEGAASLGMIAVVILKFCWRVFKL